jgi:AraC-like DNA-binding protein
MTFPQLNSGPAHADAAAPGAQDSGVTGDGDIGVGGGAPVPEEEVDAGRGTSEHAVRRPGLLARAVPPRPDRAFGRPDETPSVLGVGGPDQQFPRDAVCFLACGESPDQFVDAIGREPGVERIPRSWRVTAPRALGVEAMDRGFVGLAAGPERQRRRCGQERRAPDVRVRVPESPRERGVPLTVCREQFAVRRASAENVVLGGVLNDAGTPFGDVPRGPGVDERLVPDQVAYPPPRACRDLFGKPGVGRGVREQGAVPLQGGDVLADLHAYDNAAGLTVMLEHPCAVTIGFVAIGSPLTSDGDYAIADVRCARERSGFNADQPGARHVLVFVRRGAFVRRSRGREVLHDATTGYLVPPGEPEEFAHPVDGGDTCTAIRLSASLVAALAGGDPVLDLPDLPMDAASDRAIRGVTGKAAEGDCAEALALAVAGLLARRVPERVTGGRPGTVAARRRLVDEAREILHAEPRTGVIELARRVGCSPHHLSRAFSQLTGAGVSRYRNRIRVAEALERLGSGETDLAALACDLGFADQSHLTRTIRAATGRSPTAWRS